MLSLFNIDPIQKINLTHVTPLLSVVVHVLGLGAIIVVFCEVGDVLDLVGNVFVVLAAPRGWQDVPPALRGGHDARARKGCPPRAPASVPGPRRALGSTYFRPTWMPRRIQRKTYVAGGPPAEISYDESSFNFSRYDEQRWQQLRSIRFIRRCKPCNRRWMRDEKVNALCILLFSFSFNSHSPLS